MPDVKFTEEDLLSGQELEAGWYTLQVMSIGEPLPGKKDPSSSTYPVELKVTGPKFIGAPVMNWFNTTKGMAMDNLRNFLKCFIPGGKLEAGKSYPIESTVGKSVQAYIEFDPERNQNTVKNWKPVGR